MYLIDCPRVVLVQFLRLTEPKKVACTALIKLNLICLNSGGTWGRNVMNDNQGNTAEDEERRRILSLLLAGGAIVSVSTAVADDAPADEGLNNNLLWAVAWKQTAAEYRALCYQAYNLARMRLDIALQQRKAGDRPLAIITDMDNTMLHVGSYWGYLVNENIDFFDDAIWDEWLPNNLVTAVPGSRDFFNYCEEQGVEVFYVTSRNQGERTYEYALAQLKYLEVPFADEEHLYVFRESSDKTPAREKIAEKFNVVVLLGDNLNDYKRDYYVKDVDERLNLMERDRADWGTKFILLPNPTDGNWVRAIFGESEPLPTDENRRKLKAAATRLAWDGR
jgi:5'-nucleotidase (lipoprotein e(P4) family)